MPVSTPILSTKLYVPAPRPQVVLRPRLAERLSEGLHRKLTLISAPAGFGKTTLVSDWVARCGRPVAWLSLDEADNDPTRFLTYLVAALQTITAGVGEGVLRMLQSPGPPPAEAMLTALINEITTIRERFVLVLDDYHLIDAKPVHTALNQLLGHLPPQMHLVIATRKDPDLPLAQLRVRDQVTELRGTDLRFTRAEAAGFLTEVMGLGLSAEEVAALEVRTEGWIAGLQLAAISLRGYKETTSFIRSFTGSHRFVMDYLVEEVLNQQPIHVQTFLLRTSILDRMCGPLCDAVLLTSSPAGQATLEELERANLLLVPLDGNREWYRYHHLFAEALQARLRKEWPDQVASLHLRACEWYEQHDFRSDAIRHALAAADFERAADLIELYRLAYGRTYFGSATWLGWVEALPEEVVRARPRLCVGFAWELLFAGQLEAAEARMRDADRLLEPKADLLDPTDESRPLRASLAIARAFHAQALGDAAGTVTHARRALTLISEANHHVRGLASSLLGLACLTQGELEAAHDHMADGMASLRLTGNLLYAISGTHVMADIRIAQGRLYDAARIFEEALQLVMAQGEPVLQGTADLHLGLSRLHIEWGDLQAARRHLERGRELGERGALPEWPASLYLAYARMNEASGDLDGALELLDKAERLAYRNPVPEVSPVAAWKARLWVRQGRLPEALGWAQRRGLSAGDTPSYLREFEHVTLARVLLACYRRDGAGRDLRDALGLLDRLLKAAEEGGRIGSVIEILVLHSLAHEAQGDIPRALAPLERALSLAEPAGYARVFISEGMPMAGLLTRMKPRSAQVHKLLSAFGAQAPQRLLEPLSQRELEVLHLIEQGLSNQEIAERLFLTVSTVKGHNLRIFGKLQVQRRTEAVARARELGLLR